MNKKILLLIGIVLMAACKKDDWTPDIKIGSKFNYTQNLKFLAKPDGTIPTNPFTVDSLAKGAYEGNDGYWVSSANGLVYVFDPVIIKNSQPINF